jgi:hypothetical protein
LLDELAGDFPFVSDSDRAHWLAALLLPFVRRMINGPTPLHFVEAPCNGAGKSLLCDIISIVATGEPGGPRISRTLPDILQGPRHRRTIGGPAAAARGLASLRVGRV